MTSGSRFSRATDSGRETLKETDITLPIRLAAPAIAFGLAIVLAAACDTPPPSSSIDDDDIGGVVASGSGPEAGVWVIAETDDLDTRFARIVVTDDEGRFVVPDLPEASYQLWARGHGLVDSIPVAAREATTSTSPPYRLPTRRRRRLWVSEGDRTPWLMEGGTENRPLVVHFQVRPDPLAK